MRLSLQLKCAHLTDIIMFKQGEQTNFTGVFDPFKESQVTVAGVQLHVVVKNIRNRSSTKQQIDQLLMNPNTL